MAVYNEENIRKNREAMEQNMKVLAKLLLPHFEAVVKSVNNAFIQIGKMQYVKTKSEDRLRNDVPITWTIWRFKKIL